jgi:hypothetical protein
MDAEAGLILFSRAAVSRHASSPLSAWYRILAKVLDVNKAVDRSLTAAANSN